MKTNIHLWQYCAHFFLESETFQTKTVEKLFYVQCFFFENRVIYETMWKKSRAARHATDYILRRMWKKSRAARHATDYILRRMHIACWVPKAKNTHSE